MTRGPRERRAEQPKLIRLMLLCMISVLAVEPAGSAEIQPEPIQKLAEKARSILRARTRQPSELLASARGLHAALAQTDSVLAECERKFAAGVAPSEELTLLGAQRASLAQLETQLESSFQQIESKLQAAGLSSKVKALDEFRDHYRKRMATLRPQWAILADPNRAGPARVRRARAEIARLLPPPTLISASATGSVEEPHSVAYALADLAVAPKGPQPIYQANPTAADLAETPIVRLTPDIRRKADELDRSPARIYAFVSNRIEFENYLGLHQNSETTLWGGRGNDFDQAALLIALLRASSTPARFVHGRIRMPMPRIMNWLGARTPEAQAAIAFAGGRALDTSGPEPILFHAWVEAFVDDGSGSRWVSLDPSFKVREYQPGILIPKLPFDLDGFIISGTQRLASEVYTDQIREYLNQNHPGAALSDLPYKGRIVPVPEALPRSLPYEVVSIRARGSSASDPFRHHLRVQVVDRSNPDTVFVEHQLVIPETIHQSLTVSFGPAGEADSQTIKLFGGLENTPVFLAHLVPQIRLDGEIVAQGTTPLEAGALLTVHVSHLFQGLGDRPTPRNTVDYFFAAGNDGAIGVNGFHLGDRFLAHRIDRFLTLDGGPDQADEGGAVREMLHIAAVRYFQRLERNRKGMADLLQYVFVRASPEFGFTRAQLSVEMLFDRPFLFTPLSLGLDAVGTRGRFLDLNSDDLITPGFFNFRAMMGFAGSAQEHELWEEIALKPAFSTAKVFQIATANGIPFVTFDQANAAAEIAKLDLPTLAKNRMQRRADQGLDITTPTELIEVGGTRMAAYTARNTQTGAAGYFILFFAASASLDTGPLGGSGTGTDPGAPQGPGPGGGGDLAAAGGISCGAPVTVSNGNMWHQFTDLVIPERGRPLLLRRTYNSQSDLVGPFGHGWTHNYNLRLTVGSDSATLLNDSGGTYAFTRQGNEFVVPIILGLRVMPQSDGFLMRSNDGRIWRFNTEGRLLSLSDRNENTVTFGYDGQGNLTAVTGPVGRTLSFTYDGKDRITSVQDFTGRTWTYAYDGGDNLIESVDPLGNRATYSYYSDIFNDHNLKTITDPEGHELTFVYYANDKVFKTINPGGGERRFFYLPFRNETQTVDERGFRTSFTYDAQGRVVRIVDPQGSIVTQAWNLGGLLISHTDEAGFTTRFEYDGRGNLIRSIDPLGGERRFTYEPIFNLPVTSADRLGTTIRFEYDGRGNLIREIDPLGGERAAVYDEFGNVLSLTDASGVQVRFRYDAEGRQIESRDASDNVTKSEYDTLDRLILQTNPRNEQTRLSYDARGLLTLFTDPLGSETRYAYNRNNRLTSVTDANGNTTRYDYNRLSLVSEVADALGNRST